MRESDGVTGEFLCGRLDADVCTEQIQASFPGDPVSYPVCMMNFIRTVTDGIVPF